MKQIGFGFTVLLVAIVSYEAGRWRGSHSAVSLDTKPREISVARSEFGDLSMSPKPHPLPAPKAFNPEREGYPFAASSSAARRGYEAAAVNLEAALAEIESVPAIERRAFTIGVFSFVGRNLSPADGLKIYQRVARAVQPNALRGLVGEWIYSRSDFSEEQRAARRDQAFETSGSRLGVEAELTSLLAGARPDEELVSAWLNGFANHSSRSEMVVMLSGQPGTDAESILQRAESWSPWEKERVTRAVLASWSYRAPEEAWQWYNANRSRFDQDLSSEVLTPWAASDTEGAKRLLDSTEAPEQRASIIKAIAKLLAQKNTDAALNWANSLPDSAESRSAHSAIYDAAPRGIGAMLAMDGGFPTVLGIVPESPLSGTDIRVGDQIFEIRDGNGASQSVYARDFSSVISALRGEPGTDLTLRVLRKSEESGELEEHLVSLTRAQLYLNEKATGADSVTVRGNWIRLRNPDD